MQRFVLLCLSKGLIIQFRSKGFEYQDSFVIMIIRSDWNRKMKVDEYKQVEIPKYIFTETYEEATYEYLIDQIKEYI